jgi:hypothetical protein
MLFGFFAFPECLFKVAIRKTSPQPKRNDLEVANSSSYLNLGRANFEAGRLSHEDLEIRDRQRGSGHWRDTKSLAYDNQAGSIFGPLLQ